MADELGADRGDFFASLLQDHARIETQLKALDQAAQTLSTVESDLAALGVARETLHFLATEGARHEAHEEITLFPRLRSVAEFRQILSALDFQHQMNRSAGRELRAYVERFAPGGGRELRRLAFRFVEMHRGHAIAEERALFPLAASRLSPQELAEMSREMHERRGMPGAPADEKRPA